MRFLNRTPAPDGTSDKTIVNLYKISKNPHDIAPLYNKYGKRLFFFCRKFISNPDDCYDSVIDIFLLVINDLKKHNVNNFEKWLFAVARHYCLDKKKKKSRLEFAALDENAIASRHQLHIEETILNKNSEISLQLELKRALNNLDEKQNLCMKLFYYDDKTYKEIAEITDFTTQQVKSYIQNGKRNLKKILSSKNGAISNRV